MKELSMEEKAKAYDIALNKIKRLLGTGSNCSREELEYVFPELKESEDERIKKSLIDMLKNDEKCYLKEIAWLEKQGEHAKFRDSIQIGDKVTRNEDGVLVNLSQLNRVAKKDEKQGEKTKPIESFNTEFERQVSCLIASAMNKDYEYTKDFVKWTSDALLNYAKLEIEKNSMGISEATKQKLEDSLNEALEKETPESWNKFLEKQGEQKHAWSEEDETVLNNLIYALANDRIGNDRDEYISWLKSLKERYTWKPSDEQIQALQYQVYSTFEGSWQYKASKELLEQLKKL